MRDTLYMRVSVVVALETASLGPLGARNEDHDMACDVQLHATYVVTVYKTASGCSCWSFRVNLNASITLLRLSLRGHREWDRREPNPSSYC
jgi:hypothetical protein